MTESIDEACRFEARCTNASASPTDESPASLNDVITTENTLQQALNEYFGSVSNAFESLLEYKRATNTILTQK